MSRFTVLLAGRSQPTDALRRAVAGTRVIAADAGIAHAAPLGVTPELWVGDFDSAPDRPAVETAGVRRETYPAEKDATDGEIAIEAAIARGARSLLLVGALGGARSDHAFAHLILSLRYAEAGLDVDLFDGVERAWPLKPGAKPQDFDLARGAQFSILKFSDLAGLTIEGARYPLTDATVGFHSILTQSNEALGPIVVTLREGVAILLSQADRHAH